MYNFKIFHFCRLARAGPRSEPTAYENVHFNGSFRRANAAPRGMKDTNYPPGLQMLRRPRCGRDESIPLHTIGSNDIVSDTKSGICLSIDTHSACHFSLFAPGANCNGKCGETAGDL